MANNDNKTSVKEYFETLEEIRDELAGLAALLTFWDHDEVTMTPSVIETKINSMERAQHLADEAGARDLSSLLASIQRSLRIFAEGKAPTGEIDFLLPVLQEANRMVNAAKVTLGVSVVLTPEQVAQYKDDLQQARDWRAAGHPMDPS